MSLARVVSRNDRNSAARATIGIRKQPPAASASTGGFRFEFRAGATPLSGERPRHSPIPIQRSFEMLRNTQKTNHTHAHNDAEAAPRMKDQGIARERLTYRVPSLAKLLDLSPHYIRKEIREGRLRAHLIGQIWLVSVDDARAWLASKPTNQAEGAE
jgi:excisionase family DNA binding protein